MRTTFSVVDGQPVQVIGTGESFSLEVADFSELPEAERLKASQQRVADDAQTPFDLANDALVRVHVIRASGNRNRLLLVMHHIVSDGWSLGILARELAALYAQHCGGAAAELAELPIQYADYAIWQRGWLAGEELRRQLSYWDEQLDGAPALLQ